MLKKSQMGAAESAELPDDRGGSELVTPERLVQIGRIEATLLLLQLALVKITKDKSLRSGFTVSEPPRLIDLPELCRITQLCRGEGDQALIFVNEAAVWLFYNRLATDELQQRAQALVQEMIRALEAWRRNPNAIVDPLIANWEGQLEKLKSASQAAELEQAAAASRAASRATQRPRPTVTIKGETVIPSALKTGPGTEKRVRFAI